MEQASGEPSGGGSGAAQANWRDQLPDDLKGDPSLASVQDVQSLAKQFVDAQKHIGGSIRIPGEDAGSEDWNAFTQKITSKTDRLMPKPNLEDPESVDAVLKSMGAPEAKEGYKVEGVEETDPDLNFVRELAAQSKMTQRQFQNAYTKYKEGSEAQRQQTEQRLKENKDGLMREWGMAFDENNQKAVDTLKKTGAPESLVKAAEAGEVDANTLKWALNLNKILGSEGSPATGDGKGDSNATLTPAEAQNQLNEVYKNKEHPYWNSRDPGHKSAIERVVKLNRAIIGG